MPVPQEKSVDDLIAELERVRAQKAVLEKHEQEVTAALRKRVQEQAERLQKLGVAPPAGDPDRVGRIIIEGNEKKDEKKILGALGLRPGEVLRSPALEDARVKLQKAGFGGATVEVLPSDLDPKCKDIRIRVGGEEPPPPRLPLPRS